jgi:hypothetical protein
MIPIGGGHLGISLWFVALVLVAAVVAVVILGCAIASGAHPRKSD